MAREIWVIEFKHKSNNAWTPDTEEAYIFKSNAKGKAERLDREGDGYEYRAVRYIPEEDEK